MNVDVVRKAPDFDAIVPARIRRSEKLAEGFQFTEGPVWWPAEKALLFSRSEQQRHLPATSPTARVSTSFGSQSGYAGADVDEYGQPGSNGLTLDPQGRLTIDQHGNRRVVAPGRDGAQTVLADRYQGKRLNSPNDLVYRSDGTLYFTDPPFGLPKFFDDPRKELPFSRRLRGAPDGKLRLVTDRADRAERPRLLARTRSSSTSATGTTTKKVVMRYPVTARRRARQGRGVLRHDRGAGRGGARRPQGRPARATCTCRAPAGSGSWRPTAGTSARSCRPRQPHNFAWGDADGRTLYLCARSALYKMRLGIPGIRPSGPLGRASGKDERFQGRLPEGSRAGASHVTRAR